MQHNIHTEKLCPITITIQQLGSMLQQSFTDFQKMAVTCVTEQMTQKQNIPNCVLQLYHAQNLKGHIQNLNFRFVACFSAITLKLEVVTFVLPSMYFQESLVIPVVMIIIAKVIFSLVLLTPGKRDVQVPLQHSAYLQDHISTFVAEGQEAVFCIHQHFPSQYPEEQISLLVKSQIGNIEQFSN